MSAETERDTMVASSEIEKDAAIIGLIADPDNETSKSRRVAPTVWFWGSLADCRRLAAVTGLDIRSTPGLRSQNAELWDGGTYVGFISNPGDNVNHFGIRIGFPW